MTDRREIIKGPTKADQIRLMRAQGFHCSSIAEILGVPVQAVLSFCFHNNIPRGRDIAIVEKAAELRAQGLKLREIAKELGRDESTVSKYLKQWREIQEARNAG